MIGILEKFIGGISEKLTERIPGESQNKFEIANSDHKEIP